MKDVEEEGCVLCCSRLFLPCVLYSKGDTAQQVLLTYSSDYRRSLKVEFMEGDVSFAPTAGMRKGGFQLLNENDKSAYRFNVHRNYSVYCLQPDVRLIAYSILRKLHTAQTHCNLKKCH
jgi:hypothetical protein